MSLDQLEAAMNLLPKDSVVEITLSEKAYEEFTKSFYIKDKNDELKISHAVLTNGTIRIKKA